LVTSAIKGKLAKVKLHKTLNIMQVLPSLVSGGVETGTIDIARALIEAGHRAIVVSAGGSMVSQLNEMGAKHITMPVHSKNPFVIRKNARILKQLILGEGIDAVHARSRAPAWSCYWATKLTNTPYVTTFHGTYGHQGRLKRWYNSIMLRSDMTVAVSNFIAEHITSIYSDFVKKTKHENKIIHRGIDINKFDPEALTSERKLQLRKLWNVPEDHLVIMLPGRITRWKGQTFLIEALAKIQQDNITCLLVGDNKGKDHFVNELETLIHSHKLQNRIKLVGGCSDMPAAYSITDIVVSASTDPEAFGRVACEAQAMECLVIATKHGGSLETIAPEQQHLMCKVSDSESMAKSILTALVLTQEENNKKKHSVVSASRHYIEQHFSLELMCRDTLSLYQRVIDNKTAS
jgi:glycosyltransferase involved in cell wall biosynthesis